MFCSGAPNVHGLSILINFSGCQTFQRPAFIQQILCHRLRISDFFLLMMQYKLGNQLCIYSSAEVWAPFINAFCGNDCDLFKAFKLQFPTADVLEADIHGNQSKWAHVAGQRVGSILLSNSYPIHAIWALVPSLVVWGLVLGFLGKFCCHLQSLLHIHSLSFLPLIGHSRKRHCSPCCPALHPQRRHG